MGITNYDDLTLSGDLIVGDDVTITDDLAVGGDLALTGGLSAASVTVGNSVYMSTGVSLTNANIKNLRATPITLVAAPGASKVIEFVSAELKLIYGSDVLTETGDNMAIRYTDGSGVIVSETIEATNFIDAAATTLTSAVLKKDNIVAYADAANKALVLHNTGDGEYGGNVANDTTMRVVVNYRIVSI